MAAGVFRKYFVVTDRRTTNQLLPASVLILCSYAWCGLPGVACLVLMVHPSQCSQIDYLILFHKFVNPSCNSSIS